VSGLFFVFVQLFEGDVYLTVMNLPKLPFVLLFLFICLNVSAQSYYVGVPVYDTLETGSTSYLISCPSGEASIYDSLITNMPTGVNLYFKITSSQIPTGCLNITGIGVMNVGDSSLITTSNNQFEWSSLCGNGFASYAIMAVGTPVLVGDSFFCRSQWYFGNAVLVDGCTNYLRVDYFQIGGPPACEVDSFFASSVINNISSSFFVSPNPSYGTFSIQSKIKKGRIEIFNPFGETIYSAILNACEKEIELKQAAAGIYFVKVSDGKEMYTQKLVIQ
jgi:hypothetical protein